MIEWMEFANEIETFDFGTEHLAIVLAVIQGFWLDNMVSPDTQSTCIYTDWVAFITRKAENHAS